MNQSSVVELLFGIWVPPFYRGFLFQTKQFPQSGFSTPVESGGYMETRLLGEMPGKETLNRLSMKLSSRTRC